MSDETVEALYERADDLRDYVGDLVDELEDRGHRAVRPLVIGAAAALVAAATAGGILLARRRHAPAATWRAREFGRALGRLARHPEYVATPPPSVAKKILAAAAAALVSVALQRLARAFLPPTQAGTA